MEIGLISLFISQKSLIQTPHTDTMQLLSALISLFKAAPLCNFLVFCFLLFSQTENCFSAATMWSQLQLQGPFASQAQLML